MAKIRNGFVSNSSSSSFIVLKPNTLFSGKKNNENVIKKAFVENHGEINDKWDKEYFESYNKKILEFAEKNGVDGFEVFEVSVEYGAEDSVEKLAKAFGALYFWEH